jgi:ABC-type Fe3+-siderophore transport system permease subunit
MRSRILGCAAGMVALLTAQVVQAAPVGSSAPALDPLVSPSVLGTDQSRAAVCGTGGACALPGVNPATSMAAAGAAAAQSDYPPPGKQIMWPLIIGGLVIIVLIILIASSGGGDADGDLTPISP